MEGEREKQTDRLRDGQTDREGGDRGRESCMIAYVPRPAVLQTLLTSVTTLSECIGPQYFGRCLLSEEFDDDDLERFISK